MLDLTLKLDRRLKLYLRNEIFGDVPADNFGGGSDGGGTPGTPTGGASVPSGLPAAENGGVFGSTYFVFMPVVNNITGECYIGVYDISDNDDQVDGSVYAYREEDIISNRQPTVRRVVLQYRDLGVAKLTVTVQGTDHDGNVVSASSKVSLGTKAATGNVLTGFVDLCVSCYRPQIVLSRDAGAGPICITSVTMAGEIGENQL